MRRPVQRMDRHLIPGRRTERERRRVALELSSEEGIGPLADSASRQAVVAEGGEAGGAGMSGSIRGWRWLDSKGPRAGGEGGKRQLSGLSVARAQSALPFWRVP